MTICTREKPLFFDLQSMLIVKENHASGSRITQSERWMLYTEVDWHATVATDKRRKESTGGDDNRGNQGGAGNRQEKVKTECWYCGLKDHRESECWKMCTDLEKSGSGSGKTKHGNR